MFVHQSNLPEGVRIDGGEAIEFAVRAGRKGPEAVDVRLVAG